MRDPYGSACPAVELCKIGLDSINRWPYAGRRRLENPLHAGRPPYWIIAAGVRADLEPSFHDQRERKSLTDISVGSAIGHNRHNPGLPFVRRDIVLHMHVQI